MNTQRFEPIAYAALRIVAGVMFIFHGMPKVFGWFGGPTREMFSQLWFGGVIELACGLLVALGMLTRPAAFVASGTMAVAYIQFHWKLRFDDNFWWFTNHGELAILYCFVFLLIAMRGPGIASVDGRR